jgi:hypothetical protein
LGVRDIVKGVLIRERCTIALSVLYFIENIILGSNRVSHVLIDNNNMLSLNQALLGRDETLNIN